MIDLYNRNETPTLEDFGEFIKNPLFEQFCLEIKNRYQCSEKIEYSSCSWKPGWNIKFRKSGKSLCTIYPGESYFTVLIVIGKKEKERTENLLPDCTSQLQQIYAQTDEGNGQKWLMIDLEDADDLYRDILSLIAIRKG